MNLLANISFGTPWILLALAVLPAIWFLLRVTPPLPKRVVFPPLKLLFGLRDQEQTPAGTPWWLMALRLLAAAALIVALAQPQIGRTLELSGKGPVLLFVDNGWTAASGWEARKGLVREAVDLAERQDRAVVLVSTADHAVTDQLDAGAADRAAQALSPRPWLANRSQALTALAKTKFATRPEILWLSDGIDDGHARRTAEALAALGEARLYIERTEATPLALTGIVNTADGFEADVLRAGSSGMREGAVTAYGDQGQTLTSARFRFEPGRSKTAVRLALPLEMRNRTARLSVTGMESAGATLLLDRGAPRRSVGLASSASGEEPLLSGTYYLERALMPYADLRKGTISELLERGVSVLILSDIGRIAGADHDKVAKFVEGGGLLIRFAGEHTASGTDDLIPVALRAGGRYLGSALAWASPQHLAPFPPASPFGGLTPPDDVTVSRQILAEPSVELSSHSWARLADGTPMVTAAQRGKGWIVQFHVTAGPAWSSLPLSGLYVDMLRRLLALSAGVEPAEMAANANLPAVTVLDGFGHLREAGAEAQPIRAAQLATTEVSRSHPPGLYGTPGAERALNAAKANTVLLPFPDLKLSREYYASRAAIPLETPLLLFAALLLFADIVISLILRGYAPDLKRLMRGAGVVTLGFALLHTGEARADDAFDMKAALDTRLAYVVTGVADVDAMSKAGLTGLGIALSLRTSYAPLEPMGVDLERDDLSFFPLIYWPMDPREKNLSPVAMSKLADYMRSGGTILIDTRDLTLGAVRSPDNPGEATMRRLLSNLDLPPLAPVPADHVLTKSFYLLPGFPGRWDGGTMWAQALPPGGRETGAARGGDNVSPVIIGSNDWAAAWAVDGQGHPLVDVSPGGPQQREMALRFGINLVMYALTGNYKTDQVHVPAILERLGK